ncbi:MAG: hypothetical protein M1834_006783 [Cirrosporium novae-zelandiae]|nr:MAG: hypothetical protein M1834_006783 [Cirrosporium novae-zelandiae]
MGEEKDSFADLERHRLRLEENVQKLRKSLQHWRQWDAEYEGLKEEILSRGKKASRKDLVTASKEFEGGLVNQKEIENLLGNDKGVERTAQQVVDLISRRIDYVHQNVQTVEKQLLVAENKLNSLLVVQNPDFDNEEGLPVTEIVESLDEDGNVISSTTSRPGDSAQQLLDALKKVGIKDVPDDESQSNNEKNDPPATPIQKAVKSTSGPSELVNTPNISTTNSQTDTPLQKDTLPESKPKKDKPKQKTVRFSEDKEIAQDLGKNDSRLPQSTSTIQPPVIIDDGLKEDLQNAVIPDDEPEDDAEMRRQMLQYGMEEVGAVVAELTIDDNLSDNSFSDDYRYEMDYDDSSAEEEEDEHGRTTKRVISDDYRHAMLDMEKRLLAQYGHGQEQAKTPPPNPPVEEALPSQPAQTTVSVSKSAKKKSVSFAPDLDIAPQAPKDLEKRPMENTSKETQNAKPKPTTEEAFRENIVERSPGTAHGLENPEPPRKVSRFRAARHGSNRPTDTEATPPVLIQPPVLKTGVSSTPATLKVYPQTLIPPPITPSLPSTATDHVPSLGPPKKTLADTIIERPLTTSTPTPPDPENLDEDILHQEVNMEYYRMRNRMIERKGGFVEDEEEPVRVVPPGGEQKKVSRFRAARLGRS